MQCLTTAAHAARATAVVGTGDCLLLAAYSAAAVCVGAQLGAGLALRSAGAALRCAGDALESAGAALQQPAGGQVHPPSPGTPARTHKRSRGARAHPAHGVQGLDVPTPSGAPALQVAFCPCSCMPALVPAYRSTACMMRADSRLTEAGLRLSLLAAARQAQPELKKQAAEPNALPAVRPAACSWRACTELSASRLVSLQASRRLYCATPVERLWPTRMEPGQCAHWLQP